MEKEKKFKLFLKKHRRDLKKNRKHPKNDLKSFFESLSALCTDNSLLNCPVNESNKWIDIF